MRHVLEVGETVDPGGGPETPPAMPHAVVAWSTDGEGALQELVATCLDALASPGNRGAGTATVHRSCPRCGADDHGRPYLCSGGAELGVGISISRCHGALAVAMSHGAAVGIDLEHPDRTRFEGFADVALHVDERATSARERAVTWARKEAYLKALGVGLDVDPRSVRLTDARSAPRVLLGVPGAEDVHLVDLGLVPPGLVGCVAVAAGTTPHLTVVAAGPEARPRGARQRTGRRRRPRNGSRRTT